MNKLTANLNVLSEQENNRITDGINSIQSNLNGLTVVNARNGSPSLKGNKDGKLLWLHSGYNPEEEGKRWADSIVLKKNMILVVLGFGLGYHIESLVEKVEAHGESSVIVIETDIQLLKQAFENRNLTTLLKKPFLSLFYSPNEPELIDQLQGAIMIGQFKDVELQTFHPIFSYNAEYRSTLQHIKNFLNRSLIDRNTFVANSALWTSHSIKNIPILLKSRFASDLYGKFNNVPAIIVSSGPSLDKNIHLLKKAKGKALIVSMGTSLRPAVKNGVTPDFVFQIESHTDVESTFSGISRDILKTLKILTVPEARHSFFKFFPDNLAYGMSPYSLQWLKEVFDKTPEEFVSGPSVANYAFDFVYKTGANPIILIGQDLAFSNDRLHASGSVLETASTVDLQNALQVEDIFGNIINTRRDFLAILTWFNSYIEQKALDRTIIDATEGGAKINGTKIMTLEDALTEYCYRDESINEVIDDCWKLFPNCHQRRENIINVIEETLNQCNAVSAIARKGLQKTFDFQTLIANSILSGNKLQKKYQSVHEHINLIMKHRLFVSAASIMLDPVHRIFDEGKHIAKREENHTREQGLGLSKIYLFYFQQIKAISSTLTDHLNELKSELSNCNDYT